MCAAGALRHGAVGASSGGVPPAEEAGGGALWRSVGGPVDGGEQEGGHQDAQTRYRHRGGKGMGSRLRSKVTDST